MLKTVIARFQQMKVDPNALLEDGGSANKVEEALGSVGVKLRDTQGEFRDLQDVFNELGSKWEGLTRNQKSYIATMAAGSRQQSRFMAIMTDYDRTLELTRTSQQSAGESLAQYGVYVDSIEAKQARLTNSMEAFYVGLTSSGAIGFFIDGATGIVQALTALNPLLSSSVLLLTALGIGFTVTSAGITSQTIATVALNTAKGTTNALEASELKGIPKLVAAYIIKHKLIKEDTLATNANTTAKLLNKAATIGLIVGIAAVVVGLAAFIVWTTKATERQLEAVAASQKEADEYKRKTATMANLVDRYEELSTKINLTTSEKQELLTVTNELAALDPKIVEGIDLEGNARLKNIDILKEQVRLTAILAQNKAKEALEARAKLLSDKGMTAKETMGEGSKEKKSVFEETKDSAERFFAPTLKDSRAVGGERFARSKFANKLEDLVKSGLSFEETIKTLKSSFDGEINEEAVEEYVKAFNIYKEQRLSEEKANQIPVLNQLIEANMAVAENDLTGFKFSPETKQALGRIGSEVMSQMISETEGMNLEETGEYIAENSQKRAEELYETISQGGEKLAKNKGLFNELIDIKKTDASITETKKKMNDFFEAMGMLDENGKPKDQASYDLYMKMFFDEGDFERQKSVFYKKLKIGEDDVVNLEELSAGQFDFLMGGIDTLSEEEALKTKDDLLRLLTNQDFKKQFNEVDFGNITQVEELFGALADALDKDIVEIREMFGSAYDPIDVFLQRAAEALEKMKGIQDDAKKASSGTLSMSEAVTMSEKYGGKSLRFAREGSLTVSGEAFENERRKEEQILAESFQNALQANRIEQEQLRNLGESITDEQKKQLFNLKEEEKQLERIHKSIVDITKIEEGRANNQSVVTALSGINSQINSMKQYSDVYQKLVSGEMDALSMLQAVGDNPDLLFALQAENGELFLQQDLIKKLAEDNKESTLKFIADEAMKLTAITNTAELMERYNLTEGTGETEKAEELERLTALFNMYSSMSITDVLGVDGEKWDWGEFDQFYNKLRKIADLQSEIGLIDAKSELKSTSGAQYIQNMKEKSKYISQEIQVTEQLIAARKEAMRLTATDMTSKYGDYVSFVEDEVIVRWDLINQMKVGKDISQDAYEALLADIDAYASLTDEMKANLQTSIELQKQREEMYDDLRTQVIDTQQAIFDALEESDQREIDRLQKIHDKKMEYENKTLEGIKKAINEERKLRDNANAAQDLQRNKRRLAILKKDTSGMYGNEIATLEQTISGQQTAINDTKIDEQLEALEEQTTLAQQQREFEIQYLTEFKIFKADNGIYWNQVLDIIKSGEGSIFATLLSTEAYNKANDLEKERLKKEAGLQAEKLTAIFNEGAKIPGALGSVSSTLQNGLAKIATDTSTAIGKIKVEGPEITVEAISLSKTENTLGRIEGYVKDISEYSYAGTDSDGYEAYNISDYKLELSKIMKDPTVQDLLRYGAIKSTPVNLTEVDKFRKTLRGLGFTQFHDGGIVDYTGPAQVHGTPSKPEAFLDARQTQLFAEMRDALMKKDRAGTGERKVEGGVITSIGDIVVNVAGSSSSADDIAKTVRKEVLSVLTTTSQAIVRRR